MWKEYEEEKRGRGKSMRRKKLYEEEGEGGKRR